MSEEAESDQYDSWYRMASFPDEPEWFGVHFRGIVILRFPRVVIEQAYTAVARMNQALVAERKLEEAPKNVLTPDRLKGIDWDKAIPKRSEWKLSGSTRTVWEENNGLTRRIKWFENNLEALRLDLHDLKGRISDTDKLARDCQKKVDNALSGTEEPDDGSGGESR